MIKKFFKRAKDYIHEVLKIKDSPHSIAAGFAIGTALAILPTFGLGILIGLGFLLVFRKVSKVSMLVSFAFWNPLVLVPIYSLSYWLGNLIYLSNPATALKFEFASELYIYSMKFVWGNLIVVAFFTTLCYFAIYLLASRYQKQYSHLMKVIEDTIADPRHSIK